MKKQLIAIVLVLTLLAPYASFGLGINDFDRRVPVFRAMTFEDSDPEMLMGHSAGRALAGQATYGDLANAMGANEITRLGALGLVTRRGTFQFRPSEAATGHEALAMILAILEAEPLIIERVDAQMGNTTDEERYQRYYRREVVQESLARGILQESEQLHLERPVTREQLTVWTARALNIQPLFPQPGMFSFGDWAEANPTHRGLLEAMARQELVVLSGDGRLRPKGQVTRGEMAVMMKRAHETLYDAQGITRDVGLIIGTEEEIIKEGSREIKRQHVYVQKVDGQMVSLVAQQDSSTGQRLDYVVRSGQVTSNHSFLKQGDEVEFLLKGDNLMYVEVLQDFKVREQLQAEQEKEGFTRHHFGEVNAIRRETTLKDGDKVIQDIIRVIDVTGDAFDLIVEEAFYSGKRFDIVTYKNGRAGGVGLLEVGDSVEYLVNDRREVIYIKVKAHDRQLITGTVREVTPMTETQPAQITIFGYDDRFYTIPLAPYANLLINDRLAEIEDYIYGMHVEVHRVGSFAVKILGESHTGEAGYIPPFSRMRMGKINHIYTSGFQVELPDGRREIYQFDNRTELRKDGYPVSQHALQVGLPVKVYFDDIVGSTASRVEIESPELLFEIIYKGQLRNVNAARGQIELIGEDRISNPEYIRNNDWVPADRYNVNLRVDERTDIYMGNRKLTMQELQREYQGYPAYVVVKSVFGQPTVVTLSVKTGGETIRNNNVRTVNHTMNQFELNNRETFTMTEGTIVIRDGVVVPKETISPRDSVMVISESPTGRYHKNAMVVQVVTPFDNIFNRVRIGAVETVNPDTISFRNHTQYFNNMMNSVNPNVSAPYKLFTNSVVQDITDLTNVKKLTTRELFHGSYNRSENVVKGYNKNTPGLQFNRYYAFMVVNEADNSIVAMNLRQGGLLPNQNIDRRLMKEEDIPAELEKTFNDARLTRGTVTSIDKTWERVEITESHDWTDYTGYWAPNRSNIFVRYTDAIIVRNNRVMTADELQEGDYLYIMRIKDRALVIFVDR